MNSDEGAFPRSHSEDVFNDEQHFAQKGLTKRELFAAMAMQGMLSNSDTLNTIDKQGHGYIRVCENSVIYADALISKLRKEGPK